jgi:enoyl-CoA hydratase/carnithine racemase
MTEYPKDLDGLRWEKDDSKKAGYLIFDRPPMNTISFKGRSQIAAIIHAMDNDPDVRVIVIRGANGLYSSAAISPGFLRLNATECMICTGTSPLRSVRKSR